MSNTIMTMNLAITDGTFVDWMKASGTYTSLREQLYDRWQLLHAKYKKLEFKVLLQLCHT
jgi:hypothetical protein